MGVVNDCSMTNGGKCTGFGKHPQLAHKIRVGTNNQYFGTNFCCGWVGGLGRLGFARTPNAPPPPRAPGAERRLADRLRTLASVEGVMPRGWRPSSELWPNNSPVLQNSASETPEKSKMWHSLCLNKRVPYTQCHESRTFDMQSHHYPPEANNGQQHQQTALYRPKYRQQLCHVLWKVAAVTSPNPREHLKWL